MAKPSTTDPSQRIRKALDELEGAFPKAKIKPPPTKKKIAQLVEKAGPLAPELQEYFDCCDGVKLPDGERLYSVAEMLELEAPGFFPISDDGCGDFDLVAARFKVGPGAVVFWEHESLAVTHAINSSLSVYIALWTMSKAAVASGKKDPMPALDMMGMYDMEVAEKHMKKLQAYFKKYDPALVPLLDSSRFERQLGPLVVRYTKARRP